MIIGHVIMLKSNETCPLLIYIYKSDPSWSKGETVQTNGISFLEKMLPDGRGIRLNMDGTIKGFIDQSR